MRNNKSEYTNGKRKATKIVLIVLVLITVLALIYPSFFLIGSQIMGYKTICDNSLDGFSKPLAHIDETDNSSYIFAYQYDNNHYIVVDNSNYIKAFKDTLIFFEIGEYTKDVEMYGEFILYRDGEIAEELRYYPSIYSYPAQWRFNWFFAPVAKKLTVAEFEQYCIDNGLSPPYGVYYYHGQA